MSDGDNAAVAALAVSSPKAAAATDAAVASAATHDDASVAGVAVAWEAAQRGVELRQQHLLPGALRAAPGALRADELRGVDVCPVTPTPTPTPAATPTSASRPTTSPQPPPRPIAHPPLAHGTDLVSNPYVGTSGSDGSVAHAHFYLCRLSHPFALARRRSSRSETSRLPTTLGSIRLSPWLRRCAAPPSIHPCARGRTHVTARRRSRVLPSATRLPRCSRCRWLRV